MPESYNRIAGQSAERLAALSDDLFAAVNSQHDLWRALITLSPRLVMFMMSFLTLGIFWVGQQTQRNHLERSDRALSWIHLAFLSVVSLIPFSTRSSRNSSSTVARCSSTA